MIRYLLILNDSSAVCHVLRYKQHPPAPRTDVRREASGMAGKLQVAGWGGLMVRAIVGAAGAIFRRFVAEWSPSTR
jgi:hypothetical protein